MEEFADREALEAKYKKRIRTNQIFLDNFDLLDNEEKASLIGQLAVQHANALPMDDNEIKETGMHEGFTYEDYKRDLNNFEEDDKQEIYDKIFLTQRHGLNYAKLYANYQGGYDMERLKLALQEMQTDAQTLGFSAVDMTQDVSNLELDALEEMEERLTKELNKLTCLSPIRFRASMKN